MGEFKLGKVTSVAFERIRKDVKAAYSDIFMPRQSAPLVELVEKGEILKSVEEALGKLK